MDTAVPPPTGEPLQVADAATGLPVDASSGPCGLRADAARNRARLLDAATRLLGEHGVAHLTMEAVAQAAGVGKGTVFRRFGDRTGLLIALLDHRERQFQTSFLSGPPPVGPGAPALERLHAFGPAVLRHEACHQDLFLALQTDPLRHLSSPPHQLRHTHLTHLLREHGAGGDVELLAHTLLAFLGTSLTHHLTVGCGMTLTRVEDAWHHLVTRLTG
ncbi:TetR/AcrR family transcriptional regulator [Streptomyces sp. UH6]|uniref:TetR/AcrR family transcriptional regulator n=1 Tax=Streptomyces sp. UH6 TaxID=2748379 RepID=UPI0015D4F343|nr:TetR/AcrR family transcriptional regulator [Streptomyces sp. UH6]NYV77427.1 helix-turn-helix transcriptional regulator [Streptomyces sp. UH6]